MGKSQHSATSHRDSQSCRALVWDKSPLHRPPKSGGGLGKTKSGGMVGGDVGEGAPMGWLLLLPLLANPMKIPMAIPKITGMARMAPRRQRV